MAAFNGFRFQRVICFVADVCHEEALLVAQVLVIAKAREGGGVGDEESRVTRHRRKAGTDLLRRDLAGILRLLFHLGRGGGDGVHFGFCRLGRLFGDRRGEGCLGDRRCEWCFGDRRREGTTTEQQRRENHVSFCVHAAIISKSHLHATEDFGMLSAQKN